MRDEILILLPVESCKYEQPVFRRRIEDARIGKGEKAYGVEIRRFDMRELDIVTYLAIGRKGPVCHGP